MSTLIRRSAFAWQYFAIGALILVALGVATSWLTGDPHYLPRFGAVVVAVGAVLVVVQIQFDIAIEREYQSIVRKIEDDDEPPPSPAIEALAERLKENSKAMAHEEVKKSRTSAAVIVATITGCGELVHGWGDLFMHRIHALFH
jgi:hypothetical protein